MMFEGSDMAEQLIEAGILLAVGMAVVFTFLTMLIGGIHLISWVHKTLPYEITDTPANNNYKAQPKPPTTINPNIVDAITAAVNQHRTLQK